MELNVNRNFVDFNGKEILDEENKPFILRNAIIRALINSYPDEKELTGDEKFQRGEIASKINTATESCDLKIEDIALIKKLIAKAFGTFIVWQAWKMIES